MVQVQPVPPNNKIMNNKKQQLGMAPSNARNQLIRMIIFDFICKENIVCYRCETNMSLENYSIEHKIAWLHSEDPVGLYFNLDNVTFSHLQCNVEARRHIKNNMVKHGLSRYNKYNCRCDVCVSAKSKANKTRRR